MLRGILTLRLNKPTRIKRIEVKLEGKSRTEWPEGENRGFLTVQVLKWLIIYARHLTGIGPRRTETSEENLIISETLTFFNATADAQLANQHRRALSIGPGIRGDDSWDVEEEDDEDDFLAERSDRMEQLEEDDRGRGRNMTRAGPRSTSLMPMPGAQGPGFSRMQSGDITSAYNRQPPSPEDEAGPSGTSSACPPPRVVPADRFSQARGPSPAYALRDPLRVENGSLARGRKTSPRRRMPSGDHSGDNEERDITESALSPIASVEGSRFPSPAGEVTNRTHRSPRASTSSMGVRLNGTNGGSGPSDSDESGSEHRPNGAGLNGADASSSPRSSLSQRSHLRAMSPIGHADGTASPHPLHAAIFSAHPSTNNSRTSIQQPSAPTQPLVEVTRSGSNRSSLVELTPANMVETNGTSSADGRGRRDSTSLAGHFASLRHRPSQSSMSQRAPSGTGSPADSTHAVHQYGMSQQNSAPNGQPERGRKGSKFSIANALRSISRATSTSRTRQPSQPPPSAPSSHFVDHVNRSNSIRESGPMDGRMQMLAVEDRELRPFGRGGAGRSPSRTRALSPVQSSDRSDSRGRGRGIGMKVLGLGSDDADLADGGSHSWKEFKKGERMPWSTLIPFEADPSVIERRLQLPNLVSDPSKCATNDSC